MHRLIVFIFFLLITGSGLYFLAPVWMERQHHQAKLDQVSNEVLRNERIAANYDKAKKDLEGNPAAAVRVARDKLGFCREGERVYIFDDEDAYRKSMKE
jgi:hypothetical protein